MIGTLTTILVLLSILAVALIGLVVYLWITGEGSTGECPTCGGSGRSVVHDRVGLMQVRCPTCNR